MGITTVLALAAVFWLFSEAFQPPARAIPPQPAVFWGSVLIDGGNVPAGSPITAFVYDGTT
ncbi:MAG: hypothetical protein ACP5TV_12065, partial [Anaerolineae bacterium]